MIVKILGSAAGGGFPQWNCACAQCAAVRAGAPGHLARTQASVAVSADGANWLLLNASPDLRAQIAATPALWPRANGPRRASPIKAVALANADVDAVAGLLSLREGQAFALYASDRVLQTLQANLIFDVLTPGAVTRAALPPGVPTAVTGAGEDIGLDIEAFAVPGKVPLYLEREGEAGFGTATGDTIGFRVFERASGKALFFIPACARLDEPLARRLENAGLVLFDGTLWREDEMIGQGLTPKTGARMGHMVMGGADGSIAAFASLGVKTKVFIHVNNSNPVLNAFSPERAEATRAGWIIGEDGMEFTP